MLKNLFKPKPKARLKLDQILRGNKTNFRVAGCLVFSMREEGTKYYWEEWELLGLENYDSWVEFDHYSREISIYEPVRFTEKIEPEHFKVGRTYTLDFDKTGKTKPQNVTVREIGEGTIERIIGKNTYQVFEGEKMLYAVLSNPGKEISVEKYNNREYDIYSKRKLSKKQQKEFFGRVLTPFNWKLFWIVLFWMAIAWVMFFIPNSSQECSADINGKVTCRTVHTRGIYGGGGGGVGK